MILIKYWKQILFVITYIVMSVLVVAWYDAREAKIRAEENVRQTQLINTTLSLTASELKDMLKNSQQQYFHHMDSVMKANKINPKGVIESHNVTNVYRDTTILNIALPKPGVQKPVEVGDKCWGFKGVVSENELMISQRFSAVEIDLFDYAKPKKFLGIIWGYKKPEMKAFSDCGSVTVRTFKRVKD